MTIPPQRMLGKRRGFYSDNDEPQRRRAHDVDQLRKAYAAGGAQNDDGSIPSAEKDFDTLMRIRRRVKYPSPTKPK